MNADALRRLAIDKTLGELSSDAAELLDAYLAEHPEAASLLSDARETLSLVRSAIAPPPDAGVDVPMPALRITMPSSAKPAAARSPVARPILIWSRRTAVAAIVMLAFLLGTRSGRPSAESGVSPRQFATAGQEPKPDADASGFWSLDRLLNNERPQVAPRGPQLERTSPWMLPLHGEQS